MWLPSDQETLADYLQQVDAAVSARALLKSEFQNYRKRGDSIRAEAFRLGMIQQTEVLHRLRPKIRKLQAAKAEHDARYKASDDFNQACQFLGLWPPFSTDDYKSAYRTMARQSHPDHGGTTEQFLALTRACEVILSHSPRLRRELGE